MTVDSETDVQGILAAGRIVADIRDHMLKMVRPGMTTAELDAIGAAMLVQRGAESAPQVMYDFPGATCISVNAEAAHGIPGDRVLQKGDVVNIDVSARFEGYCADTGGTTVIPPVNGKKRRLCFATKLALKRAMSQATAGAAINQIGKAIAQVAQAHRFKTINNLGGHGVGRSLHEEPSGIMSFFDPSDTRRLQAGQVIAIEPFLSTKSTEVSEADDGWTLIGHPENLSAQFEHTLIVTEGAPIIATTGASH